MYLWTPQEKAGFFVFLQVKRLRKIAVILIIIFVFLDDVVS